jgi:hypothetical protein
MTPNNDRSEIARTRKRQLFEKLDFASSRMSETVRYVGFGLIALTYTIITSQAPYAVVLMRDHPFWPYWLLILGCAAVLLDYAQYFCAYEDAAQSVAVPNRQFSVSRFALWQGIFFRLKQLATICGVVAFGVLLWVASAAPSGGPATDCQQKHASQLSAPRAHLLGSHQSENVGPVLGQTVRNHDGRRSAYRTL